jgi:hypothetical protein
MEATSFRVQRGGPFVAQISVRRASLFLPIPVHDPGALAQRDLRFWPSSDGRPIGCDCRFEIIDAGYVLDDVVTRTIPNIDAECEVGLRLHVAPPSNGCTEDATTVRTEQEHKVGTTVA